MYNITQLDLAIRAKKIPDLPFESLLDYIKANSTVPAPAGKVLRNVPLSEFIYVVWPVQSIFWLSQLALEDWVAGSI